MKHTYLAFLLLLCCLQQTLLAQPPPAFDEQDFRSMSNGERYRFIQDLPLHDEAVRDGAASKVLLTRMSEIAREQNDTHSHLAARFRYWKCLGGGGRTYEQLYAGLSDLEKEANDEGYEEIALMAHMNKMYDKFNNGSLPFEQMYVEVQQSFEKMQRMGFGPLLDYQVDRILLYHARFMMELEDFEEAYRILIVAERVIQPDEHNFGHCVLYLNYLQAYWTRKKDPAKAIEYADKIIQLCENLQSHDPEFAWRSRFWRGFSKLSIAKIRNEEGKVEGVEHLADEGYRLTKAEKPDSPFDAWMAEYDALQDYIPIKLKFGRMEETGRLLQRSALIKQQYENHIGFYVFKHIKFYKNYARYHELRGNATEALRYTQLAQVLQDSQDLQNDARKFENLRHRLAAKKYADQLQLLESEKQFQKRLRNAAFIIIALLLATAYAWSRRNKHLRHQEQAELETANNALDALTQGFQEKSDVADKLRSEMDGLAARGERSQHLEQLTHSVLLTEAHWTQFRALFEQVHPGFLEAQMTATPKLTPAELRFLALEKLGLGYQEMADMLGVSLQTVYKTGQRMRKKSQS